jgi:hypothetical protein
MAAEAKNLGGDVKELHAKTLWPLLPQKRVGPFPVQLRFSMRAFDQTCLVSAGICLTGKNFLRVHANGHCCDRRTRKTWKSGAATAPEVFLIYKAAHTDVHDDAKRQKRKQNRRTTITH